MSGHACNAPLEGSGAATGYILRLSCGVDKKQGAFFFDCRVVQNRAQKKI
jgi:hypothetical protein